MHLEDIVHRDPTPEPWREGDGIPWADPDFSRRMLQEHLSQDHDLASRRKSTLDQQVSHIHEHLLDAAPSRILELGCGPGLYLQRLAALGHHCQGLDFAPASLAHARREATQAGLSIEYQEGDLRSQAYPEGNDLVMLLYGELGTFPDHQATRILEQAHAALSPTGQLLLEVHDADQIEALGDKPSTWHTSPADLFADTPHVTLQEHHYNHTTRTATTTYYVLATTGITHFSQTYRARTPSDHDHLLTQAGFTLPDRHPSLSNHHLPGEQGLHVLLARPTP